MEVDFEMRSPTKNDVIKMGVIDIKNGDEGTAVNFVDFNYDNSLLAVSMNKGDVLIARTSDWKTIQRYSINTSAKRIYFSPDGTLYALSGRDQYCKVHLTSDGSVVADLKNIGNLEMLEGDDYGDENPAIETLHWSATGDYLLQVVS